MSEIRGLRPEEPCINDVTPAIHPRVLDVASTANDSLQIVVRPDRAPFSLTVETPPWTHSVGGSISMRLSDQTMIWGTDDRTPGIKA